MNHLSKFSDTLMPAKARFPFLSAQVLRKVHNKNKPLSSWMWASCQEITLEIHACTTGAFLFGVWCYICFTLLISAQSRLPIHLTSVKILNLIIPEKKPSEVSYWELHYTIICNVFLQGVRQINKAKKFNIEILVRLGHYTWLKCPF